jgi:AAA15 family ATPase/GTPase
MLVEFSVNNYLSFKANNRLRMDAGTIKEHGQNVYHPYFLKDLKLVKSAIIYGANASGKSNLLKAFRFMQELVLNSSKESQAAEEIRVEPFRLNKSKLEYPTTFEVVFLGEKGRYRYGFTVTKREVLAEWLLFSDRKKEDELFFRREKIFNFDKKLWSEPKNKIDILKDLTRQNSLFISVLAQFNIDIGTTISKWFANALVIFDTNTEELINHTATLLKKPVYRQKIHQIIAKSDLGFLSIDAVVKETASRRNYTESFVSMLLGVDDSYQVKTAHKVFNDEKKQTDTELFDLMKNESLGSQKYVALIGVVLEALIERKILWIDELDSRFHEHLLKMIIGLFNSTENNPNGAQLICTCHNTILLKKMLRRDQMIFAERDDVGATTINSLYIKEPSVRNDASFDKDYSMGKYGAIPKLDQLDLFNNYGDENEIGK